MFHSFTVSIADISLPGKFTYPFHYSPHPLCVRAAEELQAYLNSQKQWQDEWKQGKMFGVLIVRTNEGDVGYLAAFSGILAGKNLHTYFVPPIYDLQQPQGFFKQEEDHISAINAQIQNLQADKQYQANQQQLTDETILARQILAEARTNLKAAREAREMHRMTHPDETKLAAMIRESQHQKAEYKRLEQYWKSHISGIQTLVDTFDSRIEILKTERKTRSAILQLKLFEQFRILNAQGEIKNLCHLFEQTAQKTPPAGAGECAAPKLLQYAYLHQLTPLAMAEFWWGDSPKAEIRRHGYYYPACKGKCEPILKHMLQGLDVAPNPLLNDLHQDMELEILFEDTWLLAINKPTGLLTVPGKGDTDSVYKWLKARYPEATGPLIVHRLDMATSGILLIAKSKEVHQNLQAQFKNRTIKKRYVALLEGIIHTKEGVVELPICLNPLDRPRQIVSEEFGKPALTKYLVTGQVEGQTRIVFYPLTGRTHQLRVHAAHLQGLNCPITGDELYGQKADRLYLHAEYVEFRHPISGEIISVERKADF